MATKPQLIIPSGRETAAALRGDLSDNGVPRVGAAPSVGVLRDWTKEEARKALRLSPQPTSWVTSNVGDPYIYGENERRKIWAVLGDISKLDIIWNRVLLAVWRAPDAKDLGGGKTFIRTDAHQDDDNWKGCVAMVAAMGPTAFVSGYEQDEDGNKILDAVTMQPKPVYYPQAPKIGDWVFFSRGYGVTVKINDFPCILVDKETEALKIRLPWPHAVDLT